MGAAVVFRSVCSMAFVLGLFETAAWGQVPEGALDSSNDLLSLLDTPIISASKTPERLAEAPATVLVLTEQDFIRRGYTQISEILEDLPGMEVVRPFGDTYLKNYWRGFRNNVGEPFLVLLDGVVYNNLYLNTARDPLLCIPLSALERVEVVYGPASALYGSNAFRGVINLVSKGTTPKEGAAGQVLIAGGTHQRRVGDLYASLRQGAFSLHLGLREDRGQVDDAHLETYEFTQAKYLNDRRIWGPFLENPNLAGAFRSEWQFQDLDVRLRWMGTEFGYNRMLMATGNGYQYAGDQGTPQPYFFFPSESIHLRHQQSLGPGIQSSTLLRHYLTDIRPDSSAVNGGIFSSGPQEGERWIQYSTYQIHSTSTLLQQEFDLRPHPNWGIYLGLKSERKDLQKAYEVAEGPAAPVSQLKSIQDYPFPSPLISTPTYVNRIRTSDEAIFGLLRWYYLPGHSLVGGLRHDRNSVFGGATTFRGGYVGMQGAWNWKVLVGEAYREPTPRTLFGGWSGAGSDPDLKPERSRTLEGSFGYFTPVMNHTLSVWATADRDVIVTQSAGSSSGRGALNIGSRRFRGCDYSFQARLPLLNLREVLLWGWWSQYLQFEEQKYTYNKDLDAFLGWGWGKVGDLAKTKLFLGLTLGFEKGADLTLRARYIGPRVPVDSNPIRRVGGYGTVDLTFNLPIQSALWSLRVLNLLDKNYAHPGIYGANAGTTPGTFAPDGIHYLGGSQGLFNSLMPQPGRNLVLAVTWRF